MASAVELATAYITIAASGSDLAPSFSKSFRAVEKVAGESGKRMGKSLTGEVAKATEVDVKKAKDAYEQAAKRVTSTVETQAIKVENAKRKEQIAQAKVTEVQAKAEAALASVTEAQKRATDAQEAHGRESDQALSAQKKLTAEQAKYGSSTTRVLSAQNQLALASQKVEAAQHGQESATEKANRELDETTRSLKSAEDAAQDAATPFMTLGDRIKAAMRADFAGAFRRVEREGDDAADEIEDDFRLAGKRSADGFSSSFKGGIAGVGIGLLSYVGLDQFVDGTKLAVGEAMSLEQSVGAVNTVFKDQAGEMLAWSEEADSALGLTANKYNELSTILGTQLRNAGVDDFADKTNELIGLGADFSAMFGGTTPEAVEAISSALKGERDPIEKYGISLKQSAIDAKAAELGYKKVGGTFDQNAQSAATLALIYEQSTDAQGAFARESDTSANIMQRLKARTVELAGEVGERLLPILSEMGGWLIDDLIPALESFGEKVSAAFSDLDLSGFTEGAKAAADWLIGSGIPAFGDFIVALTKIPGWVQQNKAWLTVLAVGLGAAAAAAWVASGGLTAAALGVRGVFLAISNGIKSIPVIGWIIAGITLLTTALTWFFTQTETGGAIWAEVWGGIKSAAGAVADWFTGTLVPIFQTVWGILANGDFQGGSALSEDSGFVGLLFTIREVAIGVADWFTGTLVPIFQTIWGILANGDFQGGSVLSEDSGFVGVLFTIREVALAVAGWIVNTAVPWLVSAFQAISAGAIWLWQNALQPAFSGIRTAIAVTVDWLVNTAWPIIQSVWQAIAGAAIWLWQSVIQPVWTGIKTAIAIVVTAISLYVDLIVWYWRNVLAPVAMWLWKNVLQPAWTGIKTAIGAVVSWFRDTAWPILSAVITWIATKFDQFKLGLAIIWGYIRNNVIAPVVSWFRDTAWPILSAVITWIATKFDQFKLGLAIIWGYIRSNVIAPVVSWFQGTVWPIISWVLERLKVGFSVMRDHLGRVWSFIKTTIISPVVNWFRDTIGPIFDTVTGGISDAFDSLKLKVARAWDAIRNSAKEPVEFLVETIIRDGIIAKYNEVANGVFGLDKVDTGKFTVGWARGGVLPGYTPMHRGDDVLTPMRSGEGVLVSEGLRDRESRQAFLGANDAAKRGQSFADFLQGYAGGGIVKLRMPFSGSYPRGDGFGARGGAHKGIDWPIPSGTALKAVAAGHVSHTRNAAAGNKLNLTIGNGLVAGYHHLSSFIAGDGSSVGRGADVARVGSTGRSSGPHLHFSLKKDGTYVDPMPYLGAGGAAGTGGGGSWWNPFDGLWDSLKSKVRDGVGDTPFGDALFAMPKKILDGAIEWGKEKLSGLTDWGSGSDAGGSGVSKWSSIAEQALRMTGHFSTANLSSLLRRMDQESGGNARAINNWDSNARAGIPSKGLMQVIPPTFRSYAEPGYASDIFDPLSNILASINYTDQRYSSLQSGWNRKGGYFGGGIVDGGVFDTGGILDSGSFALNLSGKPEVVLNPAESRAYMAGKATAGQAGGPSIQTGDIYGLSAEDVAMQIEKKRRQREALYARA